MKLSPQGLKGVKAVDLLGRGTQEEFSPDLVDAEKHVMVEFLSERDSYGWEAAESREKQPYHPLKPYQPLIFSSVQSFELLARASFVNRRVKASATEPFRYATFYDPLGGAEIRKAIWDQREEKLKSLPQDATEERMAVKLEYFGERRAAREQMVDESKRLLRLQVRDFMDWLKAQEAI